MCIVQQARLTASGHVRNAATVKRQATLPCIATASATQGCSLWPWQLTLAVDGHTANRHLSRVQLQLLHAVCLHCHRVLQQMGAQAGQPLSPKDRAGRRRTQP